MVGCVAASANPAQMSTTGLPSRYTQHAAPTSPRRSRFAPRAFATSPKPGSTRPWITAESLWRGGPVGFGRGPPVLRRDLGLPEERRRLRQGGRLAPRRRAHPRRPGRGRRPDRGQHLCVRGGSPAGVDRRRALAGRAEAARTPASSSPAAWPSGTGPSWPMPCPRPTPSSGSPARGRLSSVILRGRKPTGVRDLLELARPAPSRPWAYVKVAEGCDRACAFCAIPSFRGKQRSRTIDSIEAEVRSAGRRRGHRDRARRPRPRLVRTRHRRAGFARAAAAPARPARAARPRARPPALPLPERGSRPAAVHDARAADRRAVLRPLVAARVGAAAAQHEAVGER